MGDSCKDYTLACEMLRSFCFTYVNHAPRKEVNVRMRTLFVCHIFSASSRNIRLNERNYKKIEALKYYGQGEKCEGTYEKCEYLHHGWCIM